MTLIKTENLSLSYDGVEVLSNLNIQIDEGDFVCVIGENGTGKSTLIKCLLKLIKPSGGKIIYSDNLINEKIGYLPQHTETKNDFPASVNEIVMSAFQHKSGILPFYTKAQKEKAQQIYSLLGIDSYKNKCFNELSGGQKQRVLVARSLCAANNVLILDEPVSGLDGKITKEFYEIIENLNKCNRTTIIMVTHDISAMKKYSNKVLKLYDNGYIFETTQKYTETLRGLENDTD